MSAARASTVGVFPAKELLQTAEVLRTVQRASEYGIDVGAPSLDLGQAQVRKQTVVDRVTKGLESLLSGRKVTVVQGRGELVDAHTVRVTRRGAEAGNEVTTLTGANVVIATGSEARSLPGLDFDGTRILSSDHVLELTDLPPRVAIIGGGVVGCEFASMLVDMGQHGDDDRGAARASSPAPTSMRATSWRVRSASAGCNVHTDARVSGIEGVSELVISWDAGGSDALGDRRHRDRERRARAEHGERRARSRRGGRSTRAGSSWSTARCARTSTACTRPVMWSTRRRSRTWASRRRSCW